MTYYHYVYQSEAEHFTPSMLTLLYFVVIKQHKQKSEECTLPYFRGRAKIWVQALKRQLEQNAERLHLQLQTQIRKKTMWKQKETLKLTKPASSDVPPSERLCELKAGQPPKQCHQLGIIYSHIQVYGIRCSFTPPLEHPLDHISTICYKISILLYNWQYLLH